MTKRHPAPEWKVLGWSGRRPMIWHTLFSSEEVHARLAFESTKENWRREGALRLLDANGKRISTWDPSRNLEDGE